MQILSWMRVPSVDQISTICKSSKYTQSKVYSVFVHFFHLLPLSVQGELHWGRSLFFRDVLITLTQLHIHTYYLQPLEQFGLGALLKGPQRWDTGGGRPYKSYRSYWSGDLNQWPSDGKLTPLTIRPPLLLDLDVDFCPDLQMITAWQMLNYVLTITI